MDLYQKTSKAVKGSEIYNLDHFHLAWSDERRRRLMGNELVYPPSPKVADAVIKILDKTNYYPEDALTDTQLRAKLAEYAGLPGHADWITLGNGSMELIDMIYRTFINEGDEVLIPTPDYSPYFRRLHIYGGIGINVIPEDENFSYTPESFLKLITPNTKMVYASRPNNPTGFCLTRETVKKLCDTGIIVIIDEAYVEFTKDSVIDMLTQHPNLIITRTCSKAMGLAGFRLGFLFANPEIIGYINRIRIPVNISLITHHAVLAALEDASYIKENAEKVRRDRDYFFSEVQKFPGLRPIPSEGNFVLINCEGTNIKGSDFYQCLFDAGYIVRCFTNARGMPGNQYFRVTIGTHADVEGVLIKINELIQQKESEKSLV